MKSCINLNTFFINPQTQVPWIKSNPYYSKTKVKKKQLSIPVFEVTISNTFLTNQLISYHSIINLLSIRFFTTWVVSKFSYLLCLHSSEVLYCGIHSDKNIKVLMLALLFPNHYEYVTKWNLPVETFVLKLKIEYKKLT